jgi:short-subunit dehydrogenase
MAEMRGTALITGASGGIGLELARKLAAEGFDTILVARSAEKLEELSREIGDRYGRTATVVAADLSKVDGPQDVYRRVEEAGLEVHALVNNAGFATFGAFHESDLDRELGMIQVNIAALAHLTHLFLPRMVARGSGRVLNVASTAAFQPGPLMAGYYASKAFVLHFSEALAVELEGTGVTVTALCPGPTESGFQSRANMEDSKLVQSGLMSSSGVAEFGYRALMKGKRVAIPGIFNKLGTLTPRLLPRTLVARAVKKLQEPGGR